VQKMMRNFYNAALIATSPLWVPLYCLHMARRGRAKSVPQRFGVGTGCLQRCDVWVHAVSFGEMLAARPIVNKLSQLREEARLCLSTVTDTGYEAARKNFPGRQLFYLPVDLPFIVRKFFRAIEPKILVIMETEIWPNLVWEAKRAGVGVILANGRLTERSFRRFSRFGWVFRDVFSKIDYVACQTEVDAERFKKLGVSEEKVQVVGNVKYDYPEPDRDKARGLRAELGLEEHFTIVAGSTHEGEEEAVLEAFLALKKIVPDAHLIVAPRHVDRAGEVVSLIKSKGMRGKRRSEHKGEEFDVLVLDTMGELFTFYGVGDVAFVGGSLVPIGGHNLGEPALWGVPVLFGSHTFKCRDMAQGLITCGGGMEVEDTNSFREALLSLARDEKLRENMGERAREFMLANRGATEKTVEIILEMMEGGK